MLIVAIDTASLESAIALLEGGDPSHPAKILGEESWHSNRNESERVLPGLDRLLKEAGKSWEDVGGVFVVRGPGSYTSLRVGITIANTIAWIRKIPMWGAESVVPGQHYRDGEKTFAQTVSSLDFTQLKKTEQVEPLYAAPPRITPRGRNV